MNDQNNSQLTEVQAMILDILDVFIDFCRTWDLRYYMIGGSLLGTVRHKGFIPWDDDIDVGMPRRDFDRFHELMKEHCPEGFMLNTHYTDPDWHFTLSQFMDLETEIEIGLTSTPRRAHVWIDIFPLDGLPDGKMARKVRTSEIMLYRYLIQLANIDTMVDDKRERPLAEKLVLGLGKRIGTSRFLNTGRLLSHLEEVMRKTDFDNASWGGNMASRYREKEVLPTSWYGKPKTALFEGRRVFVPVKSRAMLKALYGDYMKLPPEDQRQTHYIRILKTRK